jgi:hypothetical protein
MTNQSLNVSCIVLLLVGALICLCLDSVVAQPTSEPEPLKELRPDDEFTRRFRRPQQWPFRRPQQRRREVNGGPMNYQDPLPVILLCQVLYIIIMPLLVHVWEVLTVPKDEREKRKRLRQNRWWSDLPLICWLPIVIIPLFIIWWVMENS